MRKSLSNIRKYQTSSSRNTEQQVCQLKDSFGAQTSRIPQLVCENQTLRDRITQLQKQNQELLIKSVISVSQARHTQLFDLKSRKNKDGLTEKNWCFGMEKQEREEEKKRKEVRKSRDIIGDNNNSGSFYSLIGKLREQKQENAKLKMKIQGLNAKIQDNEKQMKQMTQMIKKLTEKLGQLNLTALNPQSIGHDDKNEKIDVGTYCSIDEIVPRQASSNITYIQNMNESSKYSDYFQVREQNYKLRDMISSLSYNNELLQQKVIYSSKAIDHLWKIKLIEYQNLCASLNEMKVN